MESFDVTQRSLEFDNDIRVKFLIDNLGAKLWGTINETNNNSLITVIVNLSRNVIFESMIKKKVYNEKCRLNNHHKKLSWRL